MHFACLALIGWRYRVEWGVQSAEYSIFADVGLLFRITARKDLEANIPRPPNGLPLYRGGDRYEDAKAKRGPDKYVEACCELTAKAIDSSPIAALGERERERLIEAVKKKAAKYVATVERDYNRRLSGQKTKTTPGRLLVERERDIQCVVKRVLRGMEWPTIARQAREKNGTVKAAVRMTLPKLFLRPLPVFVIGRDQAANSRQLRADRGGVLFDRYVGRVAVLKFSEVFDDAVVNRRRAARVLDHARHCFRQIPVGIFDCISGMACVLSDFTNAGAVVVRVDAALPRESVCDCYAVSRQ